MGKVTFLPGGKSIKARAGQTLVSTAAAARVVIPQRCGGHASCLMCRIVLENGELTSPTALELRKMPEQDLAKGIRLGCQAKVANYCPRYCRNRDLCYVSPECGTAFSADFCPYCY